MQKIEKWRTAKEKIEKDSQQKQVIFLRNFGKF